MHADIALCTKTTRFFVEHHNIFSGAVHLERQSIFALLYKSTAFFLFKKHIGCHAFYKTILN
jgi:hypothetical protein